MCKYPFAWRLCAVHVSLSETLTATPFAETLKHTVNVTDSVLDIPVTSAMQSPYYVQNETSRAECSSTFFRPDDSRRVEETDYCQETGHYEDPPLPAASGLSYSKVDLFETVNSDNWEKFASEPVCCAYLSALISLANLKTPEFCSRCFQHVNIQHRIDATAIELFGLVQMIMWNYVSAPKQN